MDQTSFYQPQGGSTQALLGPGLLAQPPTTPPPGRHFGPKLEKLCLGTQALLILTFRAKKKPGMDIAWHVTVRTVHQTARLGVKYLKPTKFHMTQILGGFLNDELCPLTIIWIIKISP